MNFHTAIPNEMFIRRQIITDISKLNVFFDYVPEADIFVFGTALYGLAQQEQKHTSCTTSETLEATRSWSEESGEGFGQRS